MNASLTFTTMLFVAVARHDLQALEMDSALVIVGGQVPAVGSPQFAHALAALVGGFVPQTTFRGVPEELEDAATDTRFRSVLLKTVDDTKLPLYEAEPPPGMEPLG